MEPNFSPDGSSDIEQELGEGIEGGETLGEEVETVKTTVGEEKDAGHASDAESLATTISLGPPWHPKLAGADRPDDQATQQVETPEPSPDKEHVHIENSKRELNGPAPWMKNTKGSPQTIWDRHGSSSKKLTSQYGNHEIQNQ